MREEKGGGYEPARAPGHDVLGMGIGVGALTLLALSPWLVDQSGPDPFYKGPLIFPMIALTVAAAGALPCALRALRRPSLRIDGKGFPYRAVLLFVLMCLFPVAIGAIGLQTATLLAAFAGLLFVGRGLPQSVAIAAGLTLAIHLAFRTFLDIWFPSPWLLELIGF